MKKMLLNEYQILTKIDHPNIIKCHDFYDEPKYSYVVYDYYPNMNLKDYMLDMELHNETNAYYMLLQIARAIDYLHTQWKICHRDLRPENIKVTKIETKFFPKVILVSFQNAKQFLKSNEKIFSNFYNKRLEFWAPEMVKCKPYSEKVDIWSFGILAFMFWCGYMPFKAKTADDLKAKIKKG